MQSKRIRNNVIELLLFVILIVVDQVLKHFATIQLQASEPVTLIKNILELTYLQNSGAAFGIMQKKFSCLLSLLL